MLNLVPAEILENGFRVLGSITLPKLHSYPSNRIFKRSS